MARFTFEDIFREFVLAFGGEPGPERQGVRSADYVFRTYNVIAELKCLEVDQTDAMRSKFSELATRYGIETTLPRVIPGRDFMRDFQRVLRGPIENIVKDANQQIRGTKEFLSLPDTHGIMLIFNAGNPLHALAPQHYAELVGEVIQKSTTKYAGFHISMA